VERFVGTRIVQGLVERLVRHQRLPNLGHRLIGESIHGRGHRDLDGLDDLLEHTAMHAQVLFASDLG
jgi:hypothetical protein